MREEQQEKSVTNSGEKTASKGITATGRRGPSGHNGR